MKNRRAFTFIELVFVLVVMGIITKFGVEFLAQAYRGYLYEQIGSKLHDTSSIALETIAKRLQYRVKNSVIIRDATNANWANNYKALEGESSATGYDILEWIGYDIEGFRGNSNTTPLWGGIIDKEYAHATPIPLDLYLPGTDTTKIDTLIKSLSNNLSGIDDSAIYIMSTQSDIFSDYGWDGNTITDQTHAVHPVKKDTNISKLLSSNSDNFAGLNNNLSDSRAKLCWSAYAIVYDSAHKKLWLYENYQPWNGEKYTDGVAHLIMDNVSTFKKRQSFGVMKIQVCTKSPLTKQASTDQEQYSICKEKTIY